MKLEEIIEILQKNNVEFDIVDLLECHDDEILDDKINYVSNQCLEYNISYKELANAKSNSNNSIVQSCQIYR